MTNIKGIDGLFINLDNVSTIHTRGSEGDGFYIWFARSFSDLELSGRIPYKTDARAEARIIEIIKNQNSDEVKI